MRRTRGVSLILVGVAAVSCDWFSDATPDLIGCGQEIASGIRPFAATREQRFHGKVQQTTARCRGGSNAVRYRSFPWVDWSNYYATSDGSSRSFWVTKNFRGVNGALIDLEYERVELLRYNLFDNNGTFAAYLTGRDGVEGPALKTWPEMRLPPTHADYRAVGGAGEQVCRGALIRARTESGICNDVFNPLMGSSGMPFARNVQFETTFPDVGLDSFARNRQGGRISLLKPDPQVISRRLFTRAQSDSAACNDGYGTAGYSPEANCDYKKAPFFNVLAAFWIQFMTHDWFSHLEEGHNTSSYMPLGCASQKVHGVETPLGPDDVARLGCRPGDQMERAYVADSTPPPAVVVGDTHYLARAPKTFRNTNTAWWDASQLYGYDARSSLRVKRDPVDRARLQMVVPPDPKTAGDRQGYLPLLGSGDPMNPDWAGQEATGFPDNWTIGLSFFHNVFAREHNQFVAEFRRRASAAPDSDSGLRDPGNPDRVIRYRDVTPDELFQVARLVVAAEIAKIHTIEWTTQLLYDEPLYRAMNSNWSGLIAKDGAVADALKVVVDALNRSSRGNIAATWYSVLASGPGIIGLGNQNPWSIADPHAVNRGVNHFGSPFNFPEEFVTVYRLHSMVPDLIEYRDVAAPDSIRNKIPVVATFRGKATEFMHARGLAGWGLSMGRQRLGLLALQNHPRFLQNLRMNRLQSPTQRIDVAALDLIRDRERGVPRFNEFRRQYGLEPLTSFDDFVDHHLADGSPERQEQERLAGILREVYGQHRCEVTRVITPIRNSDGSSITDCLGHPDHSMVDNIEDLDTVVGWLAETTRPHGFAISETQFVVFILNASRRLYSDRFFTSSFRPEFYSNLGIAWVTNNGPDAMVEPGEINGHANQPVSPLKRVLLRVAPELSPELAHVINAFDPWARDRGQYYSLVWKPRPGAERDPAFAH